MTWSTATIDGSRPRTRLHARARPTSTDALLTLAEAARSGSGGGTGGDQWFIRNSEPFVPPRLGAQEAFQLDLRVICSGVVPGVGGLLQDPVVGEVVPAGGARVVLGEHDDLLPALDHARERRPARGRAAVDVVGEAALAHRRHEVARRDVVLVVDREHVVGVRVEEAGDLAQHRHERRGADLADSSWQR